MRIRRNDTPQQAKLEDTITPKNINHESLKSFLDTSDFKPMTYEVKSESDPNKTYLVSNFRPNFWECTCPSFIYNCHDSNGHRVKSGKFRWCKHILAIKEMLEGAK